MNVKDCRLIKPLKCDENTSIVQVARILKERQQRRIIVVDNDNKPIGLISTTDMNNKVVAQSMDLRKAVAKDVMTSPVYLVADLEQDLKSVFEKMVKHESYFVPVTKQGKLYAILTYAEVSVKYRELINNAKRS